MVTSFLMYVPNSKETECCSFKMVLLMQRIKLKTRETFASTYSHLYDGFHAINAVKWRESIDVNCFALFLQRKLCINSIVLYYQFKTKTE